MTAAVSAIEGMVLAKMAANSKPFANGKGGLDAEEIGRVLGRPIGSRMLVATLMSLQQKRLITCVHTDEHERHRKLYYLVKGRDGL